MTTKPHPHNICNPLMTVCCRCFPHKGCALDESQKKRDWMPEYVKLRVKNMGKMCGQVTTIGQEVTFIDKLIADAKRKAIDEVEEKLPKERENGYGMISPDVGYNYAIKEFQQILATLRKDTI